MQRVEVDLVCEVHVQSLQDVICANRQFELFNPYPFHDMRLTDEGADGEPSEKPERFVGSQLKLE